MPDAMLGCRLLPHKLVDGDVEQASLITGQTKRQLAFIYCVMLISQPVRIGRRTFFQYADDIVILSSSYREI